MCGLTSFIHAVMQMTRNEARLQVSTMVYRERAASCTAIFLAALFTIAQSQAALPIMDGGDGIPSLAPLIRDVTPAVVNIAVTSRAPAANNPLFQDPFFRRFFNLPDELPSQPRASAGSGVIVDDENGYVLTNHHVVADSVEIMVRLKDRREFSARLVGSDPGTDIALLKIDADRLDALAFGDSDDLEVGDFAIAIGNPFGIGQTVTSGIISGLRRSGLNIEGYEDFIQTDASINPGNSGGALVDLKGELIGVNTAIIGPSGGNVGIGFAVPSNMAKAVMEQLIEFGEVRRGRLGVVIQDLTPDLAAALEVDVTVGAVVTQVNPESPAEQAGLEPGDVVVEMDGRAIRGSADLRNQVGLVPVGREVQLKVMRDGRRLTLRSRVGEIRAATAHGGRNAPQLSGATFQDNEEGGVVVAKLTPGSVAARNGLREGDVIIAVNRELVRNIDEFADALERARRAIALNVIRGSAQLFLVLR